MAKAAAGYKTVTGNLNRDMHDMEVGVLHLGSSSFSLTLITAHLALTSVSGSECNRKYLRGKKD